MEGKKKVINLTNGKRKKVENYKNGGEILKKIIMSEEKIRE